MNFHSFCAFIYYCIITIIYKFITKEIYLLKDSVATHMDAFPCQPQNVGSKPHFKFAISFTACSQACVETTHLFFFFFFSKKSLPNIAGGGIETGLFFPRKDLLTVEPKTHLDRMQRFKYINSYLHIRPDLLQPLKKPKRCPIFRLAF
jgi:hypothetical protein